MNPDRARPLFPLQTVLFPDGLLNLRIFEARYLDLVSTCLREQRPFGVVALRRGGEVRGSGSVELEPVGTLAELVDVDSTQPGILQVRCRGGRRFRLGPIRLLDDGLWVTDDAHDLDDDPVAAPEAGHAGTVDGLRRAIEQMAVQGTVPFARPYRLEDAGWVANRWCELLPIPLAAKQKLLELADPQMRLKLVDDFLRDRGVVRDE